MQRIVDRRHPVAVAGSAIKWSVYLHHPIDIALTIDLRQAAGLHGLDQICK